MTVREGYIPYLGYQTYYRIAGEPDSRKTPLLLLHGAGFRDLRLPLTEEQVRAEANRCLSCGATFVNSIDNAAKLLAAFL